MQFALAMAARNETIVIPDKHKEHRMDGTVSFIINPDGSAHVVQISDGQQVISDAERSLPQLGHG